MFRRILVANRGEIAVRVIRAVHALGAEAVAIHSEADSHALHVKQADQALAVGPAGPTESYLHIQRVLEAATKSGCDAVHPGYGFLSENATFIRRCHDAGLTFIGPTPEAIDAMKDKVAARNAMEAAGLPVIPGTGPLSDPDQALAEAERIGFPVMVKAASGGGGIGMSRIESPEALKDALGTARNRAEKAFGDGTIYLEKAVTSPHHVEIQVLGDGQEAIHLFDRECSIQRRFQKVLEEATAPCPTAPRAAMASTCAAAAKSLRYVNAGTIECLVQGTGEAGHAPWYFLEINRRVQVEHPVTEAITGIDIVQTQIRIAAEKKLPVTQDQVKAKGHAIEMRICAEDPFRFFPAPGTVNKWRPPEGDGIRVDAGVEEGSSVPMFYDPLLAKVIAWGETREQAIERALKAADSMVVEGVKTNLPLHREILKDEVFRSGDTPTSYLEDLLKRLRAKGTIK